ncbi:2-hydroxyacid dehydrogenase [Salinicola rhizosphaerae]|uniref:Bifunctional glyoxylate/hydroxypyruvate reductase B n=1 Tax=Salinicola rhizosphaerae TaxID=1443141 RepID=A0ABQ3EAY2_9GAMM|nr:D-glycerate dehydrogenase [Salinicola rhizosphaerae]GHB32021.1 bifunctional glyoxylate/hydroxypyruvate reductase B [Salinicola rhizosphaerae]
MSKSKRILAYRRLNDQQLDQLRENYHVDYFGKLESPDDPAFREALGEAHGLIGAGVKITPELLDAAPHLEAIASISVGVDSYPVEELTRRGILLCNTPDVLTETTADTGFSLIMASARRVVELAEYVKRGDWKASIGPDLFGSDVHGKTLGMVGFGRIGQAIARRGALGFGMKVLYSNASPKPEIERELGARRCEFDELLKTSDFVCTIVPLTDETRRMIGAREFKLMKESAIFINLARGQVVDEAAMIEALKSAEIRAAGLDVFEQEPLPADSPLPQMANVVALPHIGSATQETRTAMAQRAVDNILAALDGKRPLSPFNVEAWGDRLD